MPGRQHITVPDITKTSRSTDLVVAGCSRQLLAAYFQGLPRTKQPETVNVTAVADAFEKMRNMLAAERQWRKKWCPDLNIWRATSLGRHELENCSVLAWLLSPDAAHEQGPLFLREILNGAGLGHLAALCEGGHYRVNTESFESDSDRVDLTVEGRQFLVWIEAKTGSAERKDQIRNYSALLSQKTRARRLSSSQATLVFLTPTGRDARTGQAKPLSWLTVARALQSASDRVENDVLKNIVGQYAQFLREEVCQ